jgi:hypothetical protein
MQGVSEAQLVLAEKYGDREIWGQKYGRNMGTRNMGKYGDRRNVHHISNRNQNGGTSRPRGCPASEIARWAGASPDVASEANPPVLPGLRARLRLTKEDYIVPFCLLSKNYKLHNVHIIPPPAIDSDC